MFNKALLSPDARLSEDDGPVVILPEDVILYLPFTASSIDGGAIDNGYYTLPSTPYVAGYPPVLTNGWMRFSATGGGTYGGEYQYGLVFNHPIFNVISNTTSDFTIEFNILVQINTATSTLGPALKVFPFSFVGAATSANPDHVLGEQLELGMTLGSHQAPGGFGFGAGAAGSSIGIAAVCTTDDPAPDSYVNRGIPAIPATSAAGTVWGPHYMAVVRKNGVVTYFVNGKKVNTEFVVDEDGGGAHNPASTWTWSNFGLDTQTQGTTPGDNGDGAISLPGSAAETYPINGGGTGVTPVTAKNGFFIGCCFTYSNFGMDDHLYLRHFRVTTKARYTDDYIPEAIYSNLVYPA